MVDDLSDPHCVPDQYRIRQQAQAARLVHNFVQVASAELAPVGEEEAAARQIVAMLTMVELKLPLDVLSTPGSLVLVWTKLGQWLRWRSNGTTAFLRTWERFQGAPTAACSRLYFPA